MATSAHHYYGWHPDIDDQRDVPHVVPTAIARALPAKKDLRPGCPPVYDQGKLGSCTANAIAAAIAFEQKRLKTPDKFTPSRLFIYFNERDIRGTIHCDTGAPLRAGMKAVNQLGVCPEEKASPGAWPYDLTQFEARPPQVCYEAAKHVRALSYHRLRHKLSDLKGCLAEGYPFVFGITVYESFEGPAVRQSGVVPLPKLDEKVIGGHAVMAVGYDDSRNVLIARNSWGHAWGDQGYFYLPYEYLIERGLARDFWTIRLISGDQKRPQASGDAAVAPAGSAPHQPTR